MISKIKKGLISFLADKNKKGYGRIIWEFFNLWIIQKDFPMHYFSRFLYRKEFDAYKSFISTKQYFRLISSDNIQNCFFVDILKNKLFFAMVCDKNKIPVPKMTSFNSNSNFYLGFKKYIVTSNSELIVFFKNLFDHLDVKKVVVKSIDSKGGKGVFVILKATIKEQITAVGHLILEGSYIHQECLTQHININKIYEHSINTLRFDICLDKNGEKHLLGAVMRFGMGGNMIDNRSKGGFFVSIDDTKGCLMRRGYKQMGYGGTDYLAHPDTNFIFENFDIPYYSEAKRLALDLSTLIPNKLVGWDIAITPEGPIVIEGNHDSNIAMSEVAYGGYLKHPVINELLESI